MTIICKGFVSTTSLGSCSSSSNKGDACPGIRLIAMINGYFLVIVFLRFSRDAFIALKSACVCAGAGVAGTIEDAQKFVSLCREAGLRAEILEKI